MLKLWGRSNSLCTQRALWSLEEIGEPYEFVNASGIFGPEGKHVWTGAKPYGIVDTPEYRAMNPNGTIPTLADSGVYIWESNAIVSYLAMQYAPRLYRNDVSTFARASCWMGWCNSAFNGPLSDHTHLQRLPPQQHDPAKIAEAEADIEKPLRVIDHALRDTTFLAGDELSIADLSVAPFVQRWYSFGFRRPPVPHVDRWLAALAARPAYVEHVLPAELHY